MLVCRMVAREVWSVKGHIRCSINIMIAVDFSGCVVLLCYAMPCCAVLYYAMQCHALQSSAVWWCWVSGSLRFLESDLRL